MTLTGSEAVTRFLANEERVNTFVNTNNDYTTNETSPRTVESLPAFITRCQERYLQITYQGAWATSHSYLINDTVKESGIVYLCVTAHTSGTFATDLAADKWVVYAAMDSATHDFIADGTGASPRYVQGKLREFVSVEDFGAVVGEDITDEFKACLLAAEGRIVRLSTPGIYWVNGTLTNKIFIPSDTEIELGPGVIIKVTPNSEDLYGAFFIKDVSNVRFSGGQIVGDRHAHTGTTGTWGHAFHIMGSSDVVIENTILSDFWGDGIEIYAGTVNDQCSDVTIHNVICDGNRRQGLSVISCQGLKISSCTFRNTGGTGGAEPMAGIDMEPTEGFSVYGVSITDCYFYGNKIGLQAWGEYATPPEKISNITISGSLFIDNETDGLFLGFCKNVVISGNTSSSNGTNGIRLNGEYYATIVGNTFNGNSLNGIYSESATTSLLISSNSCNFNTGMGIKFLTGGEQSTIIGNICRDNSQYGIGAIADNVSIIGNVCVSNTFDGIFISGLNNIVNSNTCTSNTLSGIYASACSTCIVTSNCLTLNRTHGLRVNNSNHNIFSSNNVSSNNQSDTGTTNIYIQGTSSGNTLVSNICRKGSETAMPIYGVDVANNTCLNNIFGTNDFTDGGTTSDFHDFGAGTRGFPRDFAPSSGTWKLGEIQWNAGPSGGEYAGWICTSAGTPGTWKGFGVIQS